MFDFTTETVINTLTFNGVPNARVVEVTPTDDPHIPAGEVAIDIKQVGRFPQFDSEGEVQTTAVYKTPPVAPVKEVLTLNLSGLTLADLTGTVLRLDLEINLQGSNAGEYSRWAIIKGQPLYAEYWVASTPASTSALATAVAAEWNRVLKKDGRSLVTVTASGSNVLVTAVDEYQRLKGEIVQIETGYEDMPVSLVTGTVTTAGVLGQGTAWFLTKNLRLPTIENIRFKGTIEDERPIANATYTQYTFVLEANRNFTGQSAVGQKLQSKTRHIIYLENSLVAAFDALIADIVDGGVPINPRA